MSNLLARLLADSSASIDAGPSPFETGVRQGRARTAGRSSVGTSVLLTTLCAVTLLLGVGGAISVAAESQAEHAAQEPTTRNVILFVGDGMGVSTVTAARIFAGQLAGGTGEEHSLSFERFPEVALVKTYNTNTQVPDSASTMTAMVTGRKTRARVLSVGPSVERGDCANAFGNELTTLLEQAEAAGYATGIVSTATITHATPAAAYAHTPDRDWEYDAAMPDEALAAGCVDIARQLVEFAGGDGIDVMLGGGRAHFLPRERADPEYAEDTGLRTDDQTPSLMWTFGPSPYAEGTGLRADGRDLIAQWLNGGPDRAYLWNRAQFEKLDLSATRQVLGLFEPWHMQFEADRLASGAGEPSLAAMTGLAINLLKSKDGKGFFLIVEGGRIDHAHHLHNAYRALTDAIAFDAAVAGALESTNPVNTLIVVTADHSHTFTIGGYPRRGNPILGKVELASGKLALDANQLPYATLSYAIGPGYREEPPDLTEVDTEAPNFQQVATVKRETGTHSGEDVAAYANGLGASKLGGVIEQNELYQVMYDALFGESTED